MRSLRCKIAATVSDKSLEREKESLFEANVAARDFLSRWTTCCAGRVLEVIEQRNPGLAVT